MVASMRFVEGWSWRVGDLGRPMKCSKLSSRARLKTVTMAATLASSSRDLQREATHLSEPYIPPCAKSWYGGDGIDGRSSVASSIDNIGRTHWSIGV